MRVARGLIVAVAGAVGFSAGCAPALEYVPTEQVAAVVQGEPASLYSVPPEAPRGDVTLISHGVVSVKPKQGGDSTKAVHVGVTLSNDQDKGAWTFDVREQWLLAPGAPPVSPALISSSPATEAVTVQPGQEQTLDLYFRPPAGFKGDKLRSFDVLWSVRTPSRVVTERTPFEREDPRAGYGFAPSVSVGLGLGYGYGSVGYGSAWWYDPLYYPYFGYPYPVRYGGYYPWYPNYYPAYVPAYRRRPVEPLGAPPASWRRSPAAPFASPPAMPSRPHMSAPASSPPPAPPAPSVPSQPNISAPAPR
jgi:hypothetical protein